MMGQWQAETAAEEREEGTAGRRQGRVMRIFGEKERGRCQQEEEEEEEEEEEGNEEAEECKEEDEEEEEEEEEEGDCFFESLDRVQSSVSFAADIPSSDDEDEEDDVRISFASAIAPPCDFRRISFAAQEEVGCDTDDDRGGGQNFDYDIWMAEPMEMSLKERRLRLLQGMGLTSSKDLARSRSSIQSGRIPSRLASSRLSSCVTASDDAAPVADAAAKAASASPASSLLPIIARCRSDTELAALVVRGSASPGPAPALIRADSAPPSISDQRGLPRMWRMLGQEGEGGSGTGGRDVVDGPSLTLASSVRIKNLDTGKEFVVSEISKDGTWGRLNDLQTGLQLTMDEFEKFLGYSPIVKELMRRANLGCEGNRKTSTSTSSQQAKTSKLSGRKKGGWFKNIKFVASSVTGLILEKDKGDAGSNAMGKSSGGSNSSDWLKVHQHGKSYKELTGLYMCQEIHAHQGAIWTMKFSSDWRYLASAGEDRTVNVWQVIECDALSSSLRRQESRSSSHPHQPTANGSLDHSPPLGLQPSRKTKKGKSSGKSIPDYIVMPETIFSLTEKPVCSLEGHLDDVLDLSWSKSQHLLSSSMDKTVRLWDMESKACLKLFAHNDYVTCIQFNPTDDSYFISGSLDAKVRIWSIPDRQVVDWSDLHEMVTAVCYTPDGQGALVGSHKGSCRYYKISDYKLNQEAQIDIRSKKKKSHAKKITGFQFAPGNPSEVLITSADSQIRVFDGLDMIHKFRGFKNTSSQISASYTSDGKYVVCASEDSHVYIWKRDPPRSLGAGGKSKGWSTTRSHEHFFCKDVSVAIPWPGNGSNLGPTSPSLPLWSRRYTHERGESSDSQISTTSEDNFPISRSHYPPLPKKNSSEQTLPCTDEFRDISHLGSEIGSGSFASASSSSMRSGAASSSISDSGTFSSSLSSWGWSVGGSNRTSNIGAANAWGLVVVTASLGGDIRIYQNFGLPLRLSRQTNLFS